MTTAKLAIIAIAGLLAVGGVGTAFADLISSERDDEPVKEVELRKDDGDDGVEVEDERDDGDRDRDKGDGDSTAADDRTAGGHDGDTRSQAPGGTASAGPEDTGGYDGDSASAVGVEPVPAPAPEPSPYYGDDGASYSGGGSDG